MKNLVKQVVVASVALLTTMVGTVQAALTEATHVTPVITEVTSDAAIVFGAFIIVVGTVLSMEIGIKLVKRFGKKI
jgi:uncharacterized membrane protein